MRFSLGPARVARGPDPLQLTGKIERTDEKHHPDKRHEPR